MTNDTVTPDTIERELLLPQPVDRVWTALTDPAELTRWFPDRADIDVRAGGTGVISFDVEGGTHDARVLVETVEPMQRFAFWWGEGPEVGVGHGTRVEFTLEPADGGTRLRLLETGFAALPDPARRDGNVEGWQTKLGQLVDLLAGTAA